jgi:hypothetical protein
MTIFRQILLRILNILEKLRRENHGTHFMYNNFFRENRAVYEIMSKNVEPEGPQMMSQYGANALHAGQARLHERMRAPTLAATHTNIRTHARTDK